MRSQLLLGHVGHTRYHPKKHQLHYPIYMYGLDLDELPELDRRFPLFGYNRMRPSAIYDRDYVHRGHGGIKEKVLKLLGKQGLDAVVTRVFLITSARYFHYVFNPVSFFYCFTPNDDLAAIVAEVNNTYGERHLYVLTDKSPQSEEGVTRYRAEKAFHVSPFNDLEGTYTFHFSDVNDGIDVKIELIKEGRLVFDADLIARAIPFTPWQHTKLMLRHPVVPHLSIPRIYWQAFRLYFFKKLKFHDKPVPVSPLTTPKTSRFQRVCQKLVFSALGKIQAGRLRLILPGGLEREFGDTRAEKTGQIQMMNHQFFSRLVLHGDIGFGESYMAGEWDSLDLLALFDVLIDNRDLIGDGNWLTSLPSMIAERLAHFSRKNSILGSRKNIRQHYDLGNDFYTLFLDESMAYSCAVFGSTQESLDSAQINKYRRMMEKAEIDSGDHVLEIGCGWGGFAIEAVKRTGCRVTGITVSEAQASLAQQRIRRQGLQDRIDIQLMDYRDVRGCFDKIVSIEMLEAVGEKYIPTFFQTCDGLLKDDGIVAFQTITIPDERYATYRKQRDWIQKHIFPGGHLPCLDVIRRTITRHTSLVIEQVENIGLHYARTLNHWRRRLEENRDRITALGFDREFFRKWRYYFAICEAGFAKEAIGDIQVVLKRAKTA